ncbi:MAG: glycosyltransferase family 4 protein [Pseudomonadota bacterium]
MPSDPRTADVSTSDHARPLTVLQLVPTMKSGGVERGAIEIAQALIDRGDRALIASRGGRMVAQFRRIGGEFHELDMASKSPIVMYRNVARLRTLMREEGVDIVHARSRAPAWSGYYAARAEGVPFVTTYHGVYNEDFPLKRHYNAIMARGAPTIAISEHVARIVQERHGLGPDQIEIIPRGADIRTFDEEAVSTERTLSLGNAWGVIEDSRPIVMLPGRLTGWKGQTTLIAAAAELLSRKKSLGEHLDCQFVLVGDDHGSGFQRKLEAQIAAAGLTGYFRLVGHCADMEAAYKLAAVVVSASTEPEAFGRVAVEAQAMGRPIIASAHGGSLETVEDQKTGYLYPPQDPKALAEVIDAALSLDPSARAHMGMAGRARVRSRFTVEAMQRSTLAVYDRIMEARR